MALNQPVWSLVDEAEHYDFIVQLRHGTYPVADRTLITPETLSVSETTGVYKAFYPPSSYPAPDVTDLTPPPAGMTPRANAAWMLRHMWQLSHESIQTPLYYLLMVPVWAAADRLGGPWAAIYVLRLINALLIASLAPMAIVAARIVAPGRTDVAALAALFAILLPGLDLNGTRVSNDSLAAALGGLLIVLCLRWTGSSWSWRRALLVGVLLGACVMVKLTLGALLVVVAVAAVWPGGGQRLVSRALRVALSGAIALVALAPWFAINLRDYQSLTQGDHVARISEVVPGPLTAPFIPLDLAVFHLTYWSGEPWGALPLAGLFSMLAALIVLTVPVALYRARPWSGPMVVAVVGVSAIALVALALPATAGYEFVAPGRYAYPALPAAAVLCAIGVTALIRNVVVLRSVAVAYAVIAATMLVLGAAGVGRQAPLPARPPAGVQTATVSATGARDGFTVEVDAVAARPEGTWFHVVATNGGAGEVEWTVPGQNVRSSGLPADVDPGQTVSGWIYLPGDATSLRFTDVTTDGYASVGDIDLVVSRPATPR